MKNVQAYSWSLILQYVLSSSPNVDSARELCIQKIQMWERQLYYVYSTLGKRLSKQLENMPHVLTLRKTMTEMKPLHDDMLHTSSKHGALSNHFTIKQFAHVIQTSSICQIRIVSIYIHYTFSVRLFSSALLLLMHYLGVLNCVYGTRRGQWTIYGTRCKFKEKWAACMAGLSADCKCEPRDIRILNWHERGSEGAN